MHKLQDHYSLIPLSAFGKSYQPPKGNVDPDIDMKTAVKEQVNRLGAAPYFARLALLMKDNPPTPQDRTMVNRMAKIGLIPGQEYDMKKLDPKILRALERAPQLALQKIMAHKSEANKIINGWIIPLKTGQYGTDYLQRAYVAAIGLGANLPEDAVYPMAQIDSEGKPLTGKQRYVLHFLKDQIPPVNGFWSLTLYNDQLFFAPNSLKRYSLSPRSNLNLNSDGSLELYIQNQSPGKEKESNWLPAPEGHFILMLRLYWPQKSVLDGSWNPPHVLRVD